MRSVLMGVAVAAAMLAGVQVQATEDPFVATLAAVYVSNPQIKAQREAQAALDETVAQAVSGFRPTIEAEYDKGRRRRAIGSQPWQYQDKAEKALVVTQPVFNGGETLAAMESAQNRVKSGRARLQSVEQQVLLDAVAAYTDVVEKKSVSELNRSNVEVLGKQREATRARFKVGELTRTDVAQAEARLSRADADARQAEGDLSSARATFLRVVGYEANGFEMPPLPEGLPATLEEAVEWAKSGNPQLVSAAYTEHAARSDVDARIGNLLPDVTLRGVVDRIDGSNVPGVGRIDSDEVTVNVVIPLYRSGAEHSRVREAKNLERQAKYNTFDTHNAVVESVTRAWQDYNTAKAVIASTSEAIKAAQVALDGVRQENQFGVRTILDVLDAEQELFLARVNLVRAQRSEKVQAYNLLAAVGKLTAAHLRLPVEIYDPKKHYDEVKYQLIGF